VSLPQFKNESNHRNNKTSFSLNVSRDRIRVLYICGRPGPNYSFLRHQFKSNPSVDLVSFVILRDPEDVFQINQNELSLIPFPRQKILFEQLDTFDLVILEEFAFGLFGIGPAGLVAMKEYVEKGGGLMLMGDMEILGKNSPYFVTALEKVLPVNMSLEPVRGPQSFELEIFEPTHPVMMLADQVSESQNVWGRMVPLEGDGRFWRQAKDGAVVMAGFRTSEGALPVIVGWQKGRGRVMMLQSLTTWRWALFESGRGHGTWVYQRFWSNVLRWLGSSDDFRLVRLDLPEESVSAGENVLLRVYVRDESHRPLDTAQVRLAIHNPQGSVDRLTLASHGDGEYLGEKAFHDVGTHRVVVRAFSRSKRLGQDERILRVGLFWDENHDTSTNFDFLRSVAEASGGEFISLAEFSPGWLAERLEASSWTYERREALWNSPWVLGVILLMLFSEWILRRRWGRA